MPKVYLVRHGKAAAAWNEDPDPGLDPLGRTQAEAVATALGSTGPSAIVSSPFLRARETSKPLSKIWGVTPLIENRVGEIPSPSANLLQRGQWLQSLLKQNWSQLSPTVNAWREGVLDALRELDQETVVFTHFIAINAAVGQATGSEKVVSFWPGNGSITILELRGKEITLLERGEEAMTWIR